MSDQELLAYSRQHVFYEIRMLHLGLRMLAPPESVEMNLKVEAAVLHSRNLIDFLYPGENRSKRAKDEDVVWSLFVEPDQQWSPPDPRSAALDGLRERANKEISHLTIKRKSDGEPDKTYSNEPFVELLRLLGKFARAASPGKLDSRVSEEIASANQFLANTLGS